MDHWGAWNIALDWGFKMGLGGVVGWFLKRWFGERDSAADRGRARVKEARPEVVPSPTFMGDHRASVDLANRGPGAARDVRVSFTGSAASGRVAEILGGRHGEIREMRLADSPFFQRKLDGAAEFIVHFRDRFDHEYVTVLPVSQGDNGNNHFSPHPAWGQHKVTDPKLKKSRFRELGGA